MAALSIALADHERTELDRAFAPDVMVGARYPEFA